MTVSWEIRHGDCIDLMRAMDDCSVDAVVTDPPYALPGGFMAKPWDCYDGREDAGFAYWLAGLIDGEGHFAIKKHTRGTHAPAFTMKLRADERGTLDLIRRTLGIGSVTTEERDPHPMVKWSVQSRADCQRLVDLLDKYPLRAKKRVDYATWREAVCEWTERPRGNRWHGAASNERMSVLRDRLMAGRGYVDPAWSGHEFQDWCRLWASECLRVLKPGGHLLAFGGTRTYHRLACAVEDAGFEIRDTICWLYGQGFPKSLNVGCRCEDGDAHGDGESATEYDVRSVLEADLPTALDAGDERGEVLLEGVPEPGAPADGTVSAARRAGQSEGWPCCDRCGLPTAGLGTALKPSHEPVVVARKPLSGTVLATVLEHGTGALNVDGCRIANTPEDREASMKAMSGERMWRRSGVTGAATFDAGCAAEPSMNPVGRWPANVVLDERAAELLDEQTGELKSGELTAEHQRRGGWAGTVNCYGTAERGGSGDYAANAGGASRFFYVAKASRAERNAGLADGCTCDTFTEWVNEDQPEPTPAEPDTPRPRDTTASGTPSSSGSDSPTTSSGSEPTDPSQMGSKSTTATRTSRTTASRISNSSPPSSTSESTLPISVEPVVDGSDAATSAGSGSLPTPITGISTETVGSSTADADPATSESSSEPSSSAGKPCPDCGGVVGGGRRNVHPLEPTVKPIELMRWLCRLVTPPGGLIVDPFCGSGSTGCAAVLEGFDFIGLEREAEYVEIARARVAWWHKHRGDGEAEAVLAAGRVRDEFEALGQVSLFDGEAA